MAELKKIEEFDAYEFKKLGLQFFNPSTKEVIKSCLFGCLAKIGVEAEMKTVTNKCEGVVVAENSRPDKLKITLEGHINREAYDELNAFKTDGLKKGVSAYGEKSISNPFIFTGEITDMYGNVKYVAFPNCSNLSGLKFELENGSEEVGNLSLELSSKKDSLGQFFYQAFEDELEDQNVKSDWLTNFNTELVVATPIS